MSLESLMPEVCCRLCCFFDVELLLFMRLASLQWKDRVSLAADAWKSCINLRFGQQSVQDQQLQEWLMRYRELLEEEKETISLWEGGSHEPVDGGTFVFSNYVRSWVADDKLLVAGLYNGRIQPVDLTTGEVLRPFSSHHDDEVTCVALNDEFIISGSGDPGYYRRPSTDSSVRLWRRSDRHCLGAFAGHTDSVRGVALFPSHGHFNRIAVSLGMDCQVILWSLPDGNRMFSANLPGPARVLKVVQGSPEQSGQPDEVRLLAGAGQCVFEIALLSPSLNPTYPAHASLQVLRTISTGVTVTGLSCLSLPRLWVTAQQGRTYPTSMLDQEAFTVVAGGVDGDLSIIKGGRCTHQVIIIPQRFQTRELISVEILGPRHILAMSRAGILTLMKIDGQQLFPIWMKQGWRMYVSTIKQLGSRTFISDGFDNVIRTLRYIKSQSERELADDSASDSSPL